MKKIYFLLLATLLTISATIKCLAQGDSDSEEDTIHVQFNLADNNGCTCTIPKHKIKKEPAAGHHQRLTPKLSLGLLEKNGEVAAASSHKKKKKKKDNPQPRERSKSLGHTSALRILNSARQLLSPSSNEHDNEAAASSSTGARDNPRDLEESLIRMHEVFIINETIRIHAADLFAHLLETNSPNHTNRTLYSVLISAINRIPFLTIPDQYDRAFLNALFSFINKNMKEMFINDALQGIPPQLLIEALREQTFPENNTSNNLDWKSVFQIRRKSILDQKKSSTTVKALQLFILKYIAFRLQEWNSNEIDEELLTIGHVFDIQISSYAKIDDDPHQGLFASIIATEIFSILEILQENA